MDYRSRAKCQRPSHLQVTEWIAFEFPILYSQARLRFASEGNEFYVYSIDLWLRSLVNFGPRARVAIRPMGGLSDSRSAAHCRRQAGSRRPGAARRRRKTGLLGNVGLGKPVQLRCKVQRYADLARVYQYRRFVEGSRALPAVGGRVGQETKRRAGPRSQRALHAATCRSCFGTPEGARYTPGSPGASR